LQTESLWGFKISLNKTVAVIFSQRKSLDISLSIDNKTINIETKAKFLGLIFDSKLNWHEHIAYLEEKCKKTFAFNASSGWNHLGSK